MSAICEFTLALSDLTFVWEGLSRPEFELPEKDGTLWVSDSRGPVTRLDVNGTQTLLGSTPCERDGIALDREGNLFVAGQSDGLVYKLHRDGSQEVVLREIDGHPLGAVNFVAIDSQDLLWVSISTTELPFYPALTNPRPDGYIILVDGKGPRVVADGIMFTNQIRLDADEGYLYAAESMALRMIRFPVGRDGSLGEREVFGPSDLGYGAAPDDFAFDAEGNVWVSLPLRNGLGIISKNGDFHVVFEDVNESGLAETMAKLEAGTFAMEDFAACFGDTIQIPTSVAFGGPDWKTVYMGSIVMTHLVSFQSPVAGLPMYPWR